VARSWPIEKWSALADHTWSPVNASLILPDLKRAFPFSLSLSHLLNNDVIANYLMILLT